MDAWIESFRKDLIVTEGLQAETIARVLHRPGSIDIRDIDLVRTLTKAKTVYLSAWEIQRIISAEISEEEALASSQNCMRLCQKVADLYPEIIRHFNKKTNFVLRYTVERLYELAHDFSLPATEMRRSDKVLRDKLKESQKAKAIFEAALVALSEMNESLSDFTSEYHMMNWALKYHADTEANHSQDFPIQNIESLEVMLRLAVISLEVVHFDLSSELPRELQQDFRMSKRDVVALAYDFHINCGGPPLVTTPGSDFSYLCSLMYEIATGTVGEGLAGAIIDFARSRERREEDDYQEVLERDDEAYATDDNFYGQRSGAASDIEAAKWYIEAAKSYRGTPATFEALARVAKSLLARAASRQNEIGPFIVWADHIPPTSKEEWRTEANARGEELRELRIRIGEMRRALEPNGAKIAELD